MSNNLAHGPAIPDPVATIESLQAAVAAMKYILEQFMGQRSDGSYGAPVVFVQTTAPTKNFNKGDIWVNESTSGLYWSNGTTWLKTT